MARFQCTLNQLRAELHRTNVNANVKAGGAYEAHKDFTVLVAKYCLVNIPAYTILGRQLKAQLFQPVQAIVGLRVIDRFC